MVKWIRIAFPPKIVRTLFEVISAAGASETLASQFSCLAQPPVVGVVVRRVAINSLFRMIVT
jgi:phosphoribosylcarboxyaminoimidazole (NCAIR) mutase